MSKLIQIMEYIEKFGQFVQMRRIELGISQRELSGRISNKADKMYISKLERGVTANITFRTVERILEALDAEMIFKGRD